MNCPKCGGEMWDERESQFWNDGIDARGKAKPTYRCKDKKCGGKAWETGAGGAQSAPRQAGATSAASEVKQPATAPSDSTKSSELYKKVTAFVLGTIVPMYETAGIPMSDQGVARCVNTLFINAKGGR